MFVDLHCHSTASDGTLPPAQVVRLAHEKGLVGLSLTDHDTVAVEDVLRDVRLENLGGALAGGIGLGVVTALVVTYTNQFTVNHPQSWINLSHLDYMVAFLWILGLLLVWRKPATTQQQAGGLLL